MLKIILLCQHNQCMQCLCEEGGEVVQKKVTKCMHLNISKSDTCTAHIIVREILTEDYKDNSTLATF